MPGDDDLDAVVRRALLQPIQLGIAVLGAMIDRDQAGQAEDVPHVVDVAVEVRDAGLQRLQVLLAEIRHLHAAVVLDGAHRRDDHRRVRLEARLAALDVDELLGAEVGAEAAFGDDVVARA